MRGQGPREYAPGPQVRVPIVEGQLAGGLLYGKSGEVSTNRLEDREVAILSLRLLQICLVYINKFMIQEVLSTASWTDRLTEEDIRGLTSYSTGTSIPMAGSSWI